MGQRFNVRENEVRIGEVIWHNAHKGDGFVKIDNAGFFIHHSTFYRFGLIQLLTGYQVSVFLTTNDHGQLIKDLSTIGQPTNP